MRSKVSRKPPDCASAVELQNIRDFVEELGLVEKSGKGSQKPASSGKEK